MVRPSSRRSLQEQVDDLRLDRDVERGDRLVADEHVGLHGERAGDGDALALAAGELVRIAARRSPDRGRPRRAIRRHRRRPRRGSTSPCASGPSAMVSPMRMRGSSEANGSWNTIWTRVVRLRACARDHDRLAVDARPSRRSAAGCRRSCGRAWTCRSRIRRRGPSASPRAIVERDVGRRACTVRVSTALPSRAAMRSPSERRGAKRFETSSTSTKARSCRDLRGERMMAAAGARAVPRRAPACAAQARSPRGQRGANGQPSGRRSSDGVEPGIWRRSRPGLGARRAASRAGRACRDGAAQRSTAAVGPSSTMRPAYMTSDAARERRDGREIVADPDQRRAELAHEVAHLGEDLRLDRDVERGRRLVARRSAPAGAAARSRWRRAGACRRRTGADRRRAGARRRGCRPRSSASIERVARRARARRARAPSSASRICVAMVSTGLSVVIGSWNTIAMRRPRTRAQRRRVGSPTSSWPSSLTEPATIRPGGSTSPRMREAR